jgi:hypothetical protein
VAVHEGVSPLSCCLSDLSAYQRQETNAH